MIFFLTINDEPPPPTHTYGEGDILFLVQIPLASALVSASNVLVCTISCESVVAWILTKFSRIYNWDITKN